MTEMYAMQRANGDWFGLDETGGLCVPVFSSNNDAMKARSLNVQLLHFKPMILDADAIDQLRPTTTVGAPMFRIIVDPTLGLNRGSSIDFAQLVILKRNGQEVTKASV